MGAFRGLVAENVRFYQGPERKEETAFIDDVFLDVDLSDIFKRKHNTSDSNATTYYRDMASHACVRRNGTSA